jgi:hypothetical protein
MGSGVVNCTRAILIRALHPDHVKVRVRAFPLFHGGLESYSVPVSEYLTPWLLFGFPGRFPLQLWNDLAVYMSAIVERPRSASTGGPAYGEGCEVIAVQCSEAAPGKTYYLTGIDEEEACDFRGRRDDGRGVRVEDGVLKVGKPSRRFQAGALDFLGSRGVPASFLPYPSGFSFVAADRLDIQIDVG